MIIMMLRCITKKAGLRSIPQSCLLFWENTVHTNAGDEGIWQLSGAAVDFAGYLLVFILGNDTSLTENAVEIVQPQLSCHSFSGGYGHVIPPERRIACYGRFYTAIAPWADHTLKKETLLARGAAAREGCLISLQKSNLAACFA